MTEQAVSLLPTTTSPNLCELPMLEIPFGDIWVDGANGRRFPREYSSPMKQNQR